MIQMSKQEQLNQLQKEYARINEAIFNKIRGGISSQDPQIQQMEKQMEELIAEAKKINQ